MMITFVGGKIGEHLQRQPAKRLFPRWALAIQEENHWHFKFDIEYKFTFMLFKVMAHFRSNEAALSFLFFSSKFIYDLCLNQHSNSQNCTVLVKVWWSMTKFNRKLSTSCSRKAHKISPLIWFCSSFQSFIFFLLFCLVSSKERNLSSILSLCKELATVWVLSDDARGKKLLIKAKMMPVLILIFTT